MQRFQLRRQYLRPVLLLALLGLILLLAACAPTTPAAPLSTSTPEAAGVATSAPAADPVTSPSVDLTNVPVGVDADGNFYRGNPDASVKLTEFSDFQCPYCGRHAQQTEPQLDATYVTTGQVLHVFRHLPLPQLGHSLAIPAAKAAYCAGQQAPKLFWAMHDWLFANQSAWSQAQDALDQFRKQAITFGADGGKYDTCLNDPATEARIQSDVEQAGMLGIQGTPAFFVNTWFIEGAYPFVEFQDKIEKAKQGLTPPPTPTPLPSGVEFFDLDPQHPGFTYDGSPSLGSADAKLVLITFEDFKSADAAKHVDTVEPTLKSKYVDANQVRLVFKFFPDTAPQAAVGALCAANQDKFWEFRSLLYEKQAEWQEGDAAALAGYAKSLGLDVAAFEKCLQDAQAQAVVNTALEFGQKQIGVPITPSFLFLKLDATGQVADAKGFPGLQALDLLESTIDALLEPVGPTPTPVAAISTEKLASLPVGVDAEGHFYRGDPQATVKLMDFSDFQ